MQYRITPRLRFLYVEVLFAELADIVAAGSGIDDESAEVISRHRFERTGQESLSGLAFFFGLMFIIEVVLILTYGVDYRLVNAGYIGETIELGVVGIPLRMLVPFVVAMAVTAAVYVYLSRTFTGRAILAVAQDRLALQLMGADPVRVKQFAFGLAIATTAIAVALWTPSAGWLASVRPDSAEAQAVAQYKVVVPKAWGKLINFSNGNLLLEGPEGVLRIVDVEGKPPEYPKIKALVRWQ